jgi:RNase P subunit RPR2
MICPDCNTPMEIECEDNTHCKWVCPQCGYIKREDNHT